MHATKPICVIHGAHEIAAGAVPLLKLFFMFQAIHRIRSDHGLLLPCLMLTSLLHHQVLPPVRDGHLPPL